MHKPTFWQQKASGKQNSWFARLKRWMYREQRPRAIARVANRVWATVAALGFARNDLVTLEVIGRKSGRIIAFPLVVAVVDGERYLVSMLGEDAQWVRNVRAADGRAVLRHGKREVVRLEEVPISQRAPILRSYLHHAEGARPHIPIDIDAPLTDFERIAAPYPVFHIA